MTGKLGPCFSFLLALLLVACGASEEERQPAATPISAGATAGETAETPTPTAIATESPSPTPAPTLTTVPSPTPAPSPTLFSTDTVAEEKRICAVLDVQGEKDRGMNQSTLAGAQEASLELGLELTFLVAETPEDYAGPIGELIAGGCELVITTGFRFAEATAAAARLFPDVRFVSVDFSYNPEEYEQDLANVTSLIFVTDEAGYLAGVLAGCMSQSGVIGSVAGMEIPPVVRYVTGYQNGARSQNPDIHTLNVYIPNFADPAAGHQSAVEMISFGADVIFAVAGETGNGALLAALEAGRYGIGVDVDQYYTHPEFGPSLLSSAMKKFYVAVGRAVRDFAAGELEPGIRLANAADGGVGLAPYHELEESVPAECEDALQAAADGLASGAIRTGYE